MRATLAVAFAAGVLLYAPTARYGFVLDDIRIVRDNPAAHSPGAALRAFDDPYWPLPSRAGLYRPATVLSLALDWTVSGGRVGFLHLANALWHGAAAVLVVLVVAPWLPQPGALAAGLVFAVHPVHVEAVAGLVGRAELLAAVGILGAVLAARRGHWALAAGLAALAMFSKEHGVIAGPVMLLDDWLRGREARRYPAAFYAVVGLLTLGYLAAWASIGRAASQDVAPAFVGMGTAERLAVALPAVARAGAVLVWPVQLSGDYGPQVIPVRSGLSPAALAGAAVVLAVAAIGWLCRRGAPALSLAAAVGALSYLPTSNLLFPSGVVLAERNLYLAVLPVAAAVGYGVQWLAAHREPRVALLAAVVVALPLTGRSLARLPVWRDDVTFHLALLDEHPESFRGHWWAAGVLASRGDTAAARREFARADALFGRYPHFKASYVLFRLSVGDTVGVARTIAEVRRDQPYLPSAVRGQFLLELARGRDPAARALADSAALWFPWDRDWYRQWLEYVSRTSGRRGAER